MKNLLLSAIVAGAFFALTSCGSSSCYTCSQSLGVAGAEVVTKFDFCDGDSDAQATVTAAGVETTQTIKTAGLKASDFEKQGYTCKKK